MTDAVFDLICITLALVTCAFAGIVLVWIRWDRQEWEAWRKRHLYLDVPDDLDI